MRSRLLLAVTGLVALLFPLGVAGYRLSEGGWQGVEPWGAMVAGYVFFALASGGVADAVSASILMGRARRDVATRNVLTAVALLVPGLLLVLTDLLAPLHFPWFYLGFNPESRIAWNAILYPAYAASLALLAIYLLRGKPLHDSRTKMLAAATLATSVLLEFNLGLAFGINKDIALWAGPYSGFLFIAAALAAGAGWDLATSRIRLSDEAAEEHEPHAAYELIAGASLLVLMTIWLAIALATWGEPNPYLSPLGIAVMVALLASTAVTTYWLKNKRPTGAQHVAGAAVFALILVFIAFPYIEGGMEARLHSTPLIASQTGVIMEYLGSPPTIWELSAVVGGIGVAGLLEALAQRYMEKHAEKIQRKQ